MRCSSTGSPSSILPCRRPTLIKRRWISTGRNLIGICLLHGECRDHDFEAQGRRAGRARAVYHSSCRHRRVSHLCTRQDHDREGDAGARCSGGEGSDEGGRGGRRGGGEGGTCRCLARAHAFTLGRGWVAGAIRGKSEDEDSESDTDLLSFLLSVQKGPNFPQVLYAYILLFAYIYLHILHVLSLSYIA